jgi:hypothetical protein
MCADCGKPVRDDLQRIGNRNTGTFSAVIYAEYSAHPGNINAVKL